VEKIVVGVTDIAAVLASLAIALAAQSAAAAPTCPNAGFTVVEAKASPLTRDVLIEPRGKLHVHREQLTNTSDLTEIRLDGDAYDTLILLKFTPEGAKRLHDATTNRSGMRGAFVIGDRALSAVTWTGPYGMDADLGIQISLGRPVSGLRPLIEAVQQCVAPAGR
jgi:hypothetical protein